MSVEVLGAECGSLVMFFLSLQGLVFRVPAIQVGHRHASSSFLQKWLGREGLGVCEGPEVERWTVLGGLGFRFLFEFWRVELRLNVTGHEHWRYNLCQTSRLCIHIYIYIYVYVYINMCIYIYICIYTYINRSWVERCKGFWPLAHQAPGLRRAFFAAVTPRFKACGDAGGHLQTSPKFSKEAPKYHPPTRIPNTKQPSALPKPTISLHDDSLDWGGCLFGALRALNLHA